MKIAFKSILLIVGLSQYGNILSHGFAGRTLVSLQNNQNLLPIKDISNKFFKGQKTTIDTYKEKSKQWKNKSVQAVAYCQSNIFFELDFAKNYTDLPETIRCSPLQLFYRVSDQKWTPAHQLCEGDELLCKNHAVTQLQSKNYVSDPITLYIIEVKKHHTFAVGHQKILTHNMFIPIATTIGMSVPFDIVFGAGAFGCMFGPVSFCCSVAAAGIAAAITYQCCKKKHTDFTLRCESAGNFEIQINEDGCYNQHKYLKSVEDVLKGTTPGKKTSGKSKQYIKPGGYDEAVKDFESLGPTNVVNIDGKEGKRGVLSDGRTVNVRIESTYKKPTLEIQRPENKKKIKIRYECEND